MVETVGCAIAWSLRATRRALPGGFAGRTTNVAVATSRAR